MTKRLTFASSSIILSFYFQIVRYDIMRDKKAIADNKVNLIKKVSTFRSGKYTFSAVHDAHKLAPLIMECRITSDLIKSLPVSPTLCTELNEEKLLSQYIYSTLLLEGGLLNKDTVTDILKKSTTHSKAAKDVHSMRDAVLTIIEPKSQAHLVEISEEEIEKLNNLITGVNKGKVSHGFNYRTEPAKTNTLIEPFVSPPKILSDTRVLMHEFVSWMNSEEIISLDPLVRSALASFHLMLIHPFEDANALTARLVESSILKTSDIRFVPLMLPDYYNEESERYFSALKLSLNSKNDLTPFLEFALTARLECLKMTGEIITSSIRKLALRDYFMSLRGEKLLTAKQYDLVLNLLANPKPISLAGIFKTNPYRIIYSSSCERTARRDLSKLTEMKLLTEREDKSYALNMKALGSRSITGEKFKGRC